MLKHSAPLGAVFALALAQAALAAGAPASEPVVAQATLHWNPAAAGTETAQAGSSTAPQATPDGKDQPASDQTLNDLRGGTDSNNQVALTEQSLSAVNTGNTINANSLVSGAINLQDSALSGFNGIGNIMMNTGANNNLQSTMSVTIVVAP